MRVPVIKAHPSSLEAQRGQTLPFWAFGAVALLTLFFFVGNYVNIVAWQVRAQNAADSATAAALGVQANVFNEESTILYATAVDENRIRYLNQALLNTIYGSGGCNPNPGGTCDQDYQTLLAEYNQALNAYQGDLQVLQEANNFTEGGQQADEKKALGQLNSNCSAFDCAFTYTPLDVTISSGSGSCQGNKCGPVAWKADITACHDVPYIAAQLLHLIDPTFEALGRSAGVVAPIASESFDPGTTVNPATNQIYQPVEAQWADAQPGQLYTVYYSGMQVNVNWYGVGHIPPYANSQGQIQCN